MKKLFVIGNGFDSAHDLPTSYDHFRKFLCDTYLNGRTVEDCMPMIPTVSVGHKGEDILDMERVAEFLVYIISEAEPDGSKWSDLEASLGRLDYDEAFEFLPEERDRDGDINYWRVSNNNADMASDLYKVISSVKDLFSEWVDTIEINDTEQKDDFNNLVGAEDIFLTFNYTYTLEDLYGIDEKNVCHIHGGQDGDILFGHGNTEDYSSQYMNKHIGSENSLSMLDMILKKDTVKALNEHLYFFDSIDASIKEVYSIGFSFADVDLIYIKEICKRLSVDTVWFLNDYNSDDIPKFQKRLRECGFKGKFDVFHINDPNWEIPEYSKKQIDKAGKIISSLNEIELKDINNAKTVLNNWRSSHAYPLHIIAGNLRRNNPKAI